MPAFSAHIKDARALLASYAHALEAHRGHTGALYIGGNRVDNTCRQFIPSRSWIVARFCNPSANEITWQRAHAEAIGRLSYSADFDWRENFHAFWKGALMTPLTCTVGTCSLSKATNPEVSEYDHAERLAATRAPRFLLDFTDMNGDRDQLAILRAFFLADPNQALGRENAALLARLTARTYSSLTSANVTTDAAVQPRIEVGIALSSKGLLTSGRVRALAKLLDEIAEHEARKDSDAVRYEVASLFMPADKELVPIEIDILIDMIASETPTIRHLHLANANKMLSIDKRVEVFQQLLRAAVCALDSSEPTLQRLSIERVPVEHKPLIAIGSALRYPNSLTELYLRYSYTNLWAHLANTELMWAWIAYGIFHPDSACRLDRLGLTALPLFDARHLDTFAYILRSPHPGRMLYILEHGSLPRGAGMDEVALPANRRVFVRVRAKTKVRARAKTTGPVFDLGPIEADEFEVALELASYVCVVAPGIGLGWVPTSSIVSRRDVASKCVAPPRGVEPVNRSLIQQRNTRDWPRAGANVKAFERSGVYSSTDNIEHVKALLWMIGHALKSFEYPCHKLRISDADVAEILDACPNLTRLNLQCSTLDSPEAITQRYASQQCRIAILNIGCKWNEPGKLFQVAEMLASPSCAPLRYLAVGGATDGENDHWATLEQALMRNRTLQMLYVYSADDRAAKTLPKLQAAFEGSTLTPRMQTAFLSVVEHHASHKTSMSPVLSSSIAKVDAIIVSQIFAFAGVRFQRTLFW